MGVDFQEGIRSEFRNMVITKTKTFFFSYEALTFNIYFVAMVRTVDDIPTYSDFV